MKKKKKKVKKIFFHFFFLVFEELYIYIYPQLDLGFLYKRKNQAPTILKNQERKRKRERVGKMYYIHTKKNKQKHEKWG